MRHSLLGGLAAVLVLGATLACDGDSTGTDLETDFTASLTGAAERPNPVTSSATGTATLEINDDDETIEVTVTVSNLIDITAAHIHVGDVNTAGPPVVTLIAAPLAPGSFTGTLVNDRTFTATAIVGGETFATLAAKIRSGQAYVNVHTVANPGGEIRGQFVAE